MLLKAIWRFDFDPETKIVESHMSRLRAKLDAGFATGAIETIRGEGYRVRGDA
jgi:two-component system OmpR family response regulator